MVNFFYNKSCLDGTCDHCGGMKHFPIFQHMASTHTIGDKIVEFGKYKTVAYSLKDGKEAKKCELVSDKILVYQFMGIFHDQVVYEYARNTHRAQWLDS